MIENILILAPYGKDAELSSQLLRQEGYETEVLHSISEVGLDKIHSSGAVLLTEEALSTEEYVLFEKNLAKQEAWSDLPIILLINNKDRIVKTEKILDHFSHKANVLLLERPFRLITLIATIKGALRSRKKQHEVKDLLKQQAISLGARDEFLSVASHELKTPITSLKLQVQMKKRFLKRGDERVYSPEQVDAFIESTEHQISRLERLVDDMLDLSRIEMGRLSLHFETVDLGNLVKKTFEALDEVFKEAKSMVELNIAENIKGNWDKFRIEQAIVNLFTNAIKYGANRKIVISVYRDGDQGILTVTDNGLGIAPNDQARIFQRFERAVEDSNISGFGIGLYITKEILEIQGGSISVKSELGKGSTFKIQLPLLTGNL